MEKLKISQIIDAFPDECDKLIPKVNRQLRKELKPYIQHQKRIRNKYYDNFTEWFLLQAIKIFYYPDRMEKQIKQNELLTRIKNNPNDDSQVNDLKIEQAKEVSIITLHDFKKIKSNRARFNACCPFHDEKTGSFFVYPNNTFYCFGCHVGGDSIAFITKLHGFSFIEAVKYLIKEG